MVDHVQDLRAVLEETEEYNIPIRLLFVDFHKAFDYIETCVVLKSLKVDADTRTEKISSMRGVRQGNVRSCLH